MCYVCDHIDHIEKLTVLLFQPSPLSIHTHLIRAYPEKT